MAKTIVLLSALCVLAVTTSASAEAGLNGQHGEAPDALWRALQQQPVKGEVILGWTPAAGKTPSTIPAEERAAVIDSLRAVAGVELVRADSHRPYAVLKLGSPEALAALRVLPRVAFLAPRYLRLKTASSCPEGVYSGFQYLDEGWQVNSVIEHPLFAPFIDYVPWHFVDLTQPPQPLPFSVLPGFRGHRIVDAWRRKGGGRGTRIAIVDTGIAANQIELAATCDTCSSVFATGRSQGRTMQVFDVYDGDPAGDRCGHGTAAASAALAPLNARAGRRGRRNRVRRTAAPSVVGVAWEADGASVRIDNDVFVNWTDVDRAVLGIGHAVCGGASRCTPRPRQVVSMAWGDIAEHEAIKEEIAFWASQGVLFLGAAGTGFCRWDSEPVYPAAQTYPSHLENPVLAVTCVNPNTGQRSDNVCKSFDLAGVWHKEGEDTDDWPALGSEPGALVNFGSSSGCVSTVAGIAALTWAAHPDESRVQIIHRLQAAGRFGNVETGSGVVDAFLAVGGLGDVSIQGPGRVLAGNAYQLGHTRSSGDGPFRFEWTDGACEGDCDFDRATGTCRGPCPLIGTCAAGHPQCESVTLTAPATGGAQQATTLRVIDEGSNDSSADLTVRYDSQTVCAQTAAQCPPERQCGTIPDGCGNLISCGACPMGYNCEDGQCVCGSSKYCDLGVGP